MVVHMCDKFGVIWAHIKRVGLKVLLAHTCCCVTQRL